MSDGCSTLYSAVFGRSADLVLIGSGHVSSRGISTVLLYALGVVGSSAEVTW